ncbi:ATP-binding protein [Streptomyces sp. NPDC048717]|uniref:ATP-binding protein n=1 Tax=Streptomyces sp. NPDC048717 TaxID=3154928 RepID=UPI003425F4D1
MTLIHDAVVGVPSVLAVVAVGIAVRGGRSAARHRRLAEAAVRRAEEAEQRVAARDEEARFLASTRLPGLIRGMRQEEPSAAVMFGALRHPALVHTPTGQAFQAVLEQVHTALAKSASLSEEAAQAAVQAATRSMQPLGYELQSSITKLLELDLDGETLRLVHLIDHTASQWIRRLQILGILTGMWPGRQRDDVALLEAVRGGVSRIRDYQRVRVPGEVPLYVAGRYVEPCALLLSELLDNATRHSAPTTSVEVSIVETHRGVAVEIHDAGPGMAREVLHEARRRVSATEPVRFTQLSVPAAFGLVGVGALAARYGFGVSLDAEHSRYGGMRAVVHVPRSMLVEPPVVQSDPAHAPWQEASQSLPAGPAPSRHDYPVAADGLPQRRRRRHAAPAAGAPASEPPPPRSGQALAAFRLGTHALHTPPPNKEMKP